MNTTIPSRNLEFAAYALALAKGGGNLILAAEIANGMRNFERVETVLKAAVAAGTTTSPEYAALINYQTVAAGFVESLRATSVLDAMLPFARRVPLRSALSVVTAVANAGVVGGAVPKPVTKIELAHSGLDPVAVAAITVVTEDLLRASASFALTLIQRELLAGVSAGCNVAFFAALADGITPESSSGDVLSDLRLLLAATNTVGVGRYYLVVSPTIANQIATLPSAPGASEPAFPSMSPTGGTLQNIPVFVAADLPADSAGQVDVMLLEASQLAIAAELPVLQVSREADIDMADDPSLPSSLVSMFQTNSVAIRSERLVGFQRLHDSAVATLVDASYGAES